MTRTASALLVAATLLSSAAPGRAEEKLYEIKKIEPKAVVGAKGSASVTIATLHGWHVNGEAPITLALTAPAGVTLPKTKLVRGDLADSTLASARFDVAFEASEPGAKVIPVEAHFVICQETACKPIKETLSLNIDVASAAPEKVAPKAKAKGKVGKKKA
jgi:hypothetical protein